MSGTRAFNTIEVYLERGIARKYSQRRHSLVKELEWYLDLPDCLRHIAPQILDYDRTPDNAFIEMEFCRDPTLSESFLSGRGQQVNWLAVLEALESLIEEMGNFQCTATARSRRQAMLEMYQAKTMRRLTSVAKDPRFQGFLNSGLSIGDEPVYSIDEIFAVLPEVLQRSGLLEDREFGIIHGDLCLSNILFDSRRNCLRIIDPRGDFGGHGLFGDRRYDLAKLCHSFEGGYDLIVNDHFTISLVGRTLHLDLHWKKRQTRIRELFSAWLRERFAEEVPHVKLIESLLFLSMIPLHADRPACQQAFLGHGLQLFTQAAIEFGFERE